MATNPYYQKTGNPANKAQGASAAIRAEFAALQLAFDTILSSFTNGTYTPVIDTLSHGSGFVCDGLAWSKSGSVYTVFGSFQLNATAAGGGSSTAFMMTLPNGAIAAAAGPTTSRTATAGSIKCYSSGQVITGDLVSVTGNKALVTFNPSVTGLLSYTIEFSFLAQ
jgi:hypothetical protein